MRARLKEGRRRSAPGGDRSTGAPAFSTCGCSRCLNGSLRKRRRSAAIWRAHHTLSLDRKHLDRISFKTRVGNRRRAGRLHWHWRLQTARTLPLHSPLARACRTHALHTVLFSSTACPHNCCYTCPPLPQRVCGRWDLRAATAAGRVPLRTHAHTDRPWWRLRYKTRRYTALHSGHRQHCHGSPALDYHACPRCDLPTTFILVPPLGCHAHVYLHYHAFTTIPIPLHSRAYRLRDALLPSVFLAGGGHFHRIVRCRYHGCRLTRITSSHLQHGSRADAAPAAMQHSGYGMHAAPRGC